jgi:pyridoxal/pyridoxine/pyridoxamine kinase
MDKIDVNPFACRRAAVSAVMEATFKLGAYELQIVAAQDHIARPARRFAAEEIILVGGRGSGGSCAD